VVMVRPGFAAHNDVIRVFMRSVCRSRWDRECPGGNFAALE
jgi:hypothetical protein